MKRFRTKKGLVLLVTSVVVAAAAVGAYAYFSSTGSGTAAATAGTAGAWTFTTGSVTGVLYPAASAAAGAEAITGATVTNSGSGNQNLNELDASISTTSAGDLSKPACQASDWQLYSPTATWTVPAGGQTATISPTGVDLAPGGTYTIGDLSIALVDNGANQDNCQNQTVTVTFDAS